MNTQTDNPDFFLSPFDLSVQSSELAVRKALNGVISGLGPLNLDLEELSTVELVLAEALNNIVEHAYPQGDASGPIFIALQHRHDGLHVTIRDQGNPMPDGQVPIGMPQNIGVDVTELPEGGFGWFLIQDLAKDIRYRRRGIENQLDLRLAVAIRRQQRPPAA